MRQVLNAIEGVCLSVVASSLFGNKANEVDVDEDHRIRFRLAEDGQVPVPEVGEFDKLVIRVRVTNPRIHVLEVDGKKNVKIMEELSTRWRKSEERRTEVAKKRGEEVRADPYPFPEGERIFDHLVNVFVTEDGMPYSRHPDNHVRLVEFGEDGRFTLYELALAAHGGSFYLALNRQQQKRCYFDSEDGRIHCRYFETGMKKWPQLVEALSELYARAAEKLPDHDDDPSTGDLLGFRDLEPGQARCCFYSIAQGWGLLITYAGEVARIHRNQLKARDGTGLPYLNPGEVVACRIEKIQKDEDGNVIIPGKKYRVAPGQKEAEERGTLLEFEAFDAELVPPAIEPALSASA